MENIDVKNLTISNMSLFLLDKNTPSLIKKDLEVNLRKIIKNIGWNYDDLLNEEEKRINRRGFGVENYLFCDRPSMQQLMELYFTESYDSLIKDSNLLFSERHLCNNMNFMANFFTKICDLQIIKLKDRLSNSSQLSSLEKDILCFFKCVLEKRYVDMKERKNNYYNGSDVLEFNEAVKLLKTYNLYVPNNNIISSDLNQFNESKLSVKLRNIFSNSSFVNNDFCQDLLALKIVLMDSMKLKVQKDILIKAATLDDSVNYQSDTMKKVYEKYKRYYIY